MVLLKLKRMILFYQLKLRFIKMTYKQLPGRPTIPDELKNKGIMISLPVLLIDKLSMERNKSRLIQDLLIKYFKLN